MGGIPRAWTFYCKLNKNSNGNIRKTSQVQLQFQVRGPWQPPLQVELEYAAGRTGNFGANYWGGFVVHREVIAPHGGYATSIDFLL